MDIKIGYKRDYITYGTVVSLMLDYSNSNEIANIPYDPGDFENRDILNNDKDNFMEYLTSKEFLFTHGVFNEYCFLHRFKNAQDFRNNYLNTAFIVLPAFEFESMDNLNQLIKKIKKKGFDDDSESETVNENKLLDNYIKFKQEIQTNHDKSLKLMKKDNNRVNYYDCFQLMHLKSGNFLEYKRNNKDLKTYIQLSSTMSKRTLFRFIPSFEYQTENSTNVFFFLSVQIACGEKRNNKEKYMSSKNKKEINNNEKGILQKSILDSLGVEEDVREEKIDLNKLNSQSLENQQPIFDGDNLKNILKEIYHDENEEQNQDEKVIDQFVSYSMNHNLIQKNFGEELMPEDDYIIMDYDNNNFWRLINLSEDYFEDIKYLNLFDNFCIQSPDKNLFINAEVEETEESNYIFFGDNIDNSKHDLMPIKEEDEKEENKSEINNINAPNIINTNINNNFLSLKPNNVYIYNKNVNNSLPSFLDNQIQLDYYHESNVNTNKAYNLSVESYDDKEHLKPYSLFRFEPINEDFEEGEYGFGSLAKFSVLNDFAQVRIFNTFTNKVLYAEKNGRNKYKLVLIDDIGKNDKRYSNTIFEIRQIDSQDFDSEETKSEKEENSENEEEESSNKDDSEKRVNIKKNNYIKIYSKKYMSYLGIRIKNADNSGELTLTNSIADITRFKLNCIDEEDKHEVNFFEQLLLGFNNILTYFRQENKFVNINGKNYEKIVHILTKFKNKLYNFQKDEKDDTHLNLQENKFDFLEIIKHFNIVSKLIEIFLTNWFQKYQLYTYNQLEEKLKKYFEENKDILKYKLIISKVILEILTKIYDLKQCYLNIIEDSLLYFLMFVGRDDNCTTFLINILTNNAFLLVSLCPLKKDNLEMNKENIEIEESLNELNNMSLTMTLDNEEIMKRKKRYKKLKYLNIKKCLERIINDYNSVSYEKLRNNFYSVILFFLFMNSLLIYNHSSFIRFYEDYFRDLGLFELEKERKTMLLPNYEKNPILVYFYLNNEEIYVRSVPFFNKDKKSDKKYYEYKLKDLVDIIGNYNIDTEKDRNKLFFAKLVNVNLIFYSYLSLCDEKFKYYLQNIFKLDNIIKNFLTYKINIINNSEENEINNNPPPTRTESPLVNDIKCSIMQMLTYLYLKRRRPYIAKTHLFKCINLQNEEGSEPLDINISELNTIIEFILGILESKDVKFDINRIDIFCLIQFIDLIKYVLRNLYVIKNNKNQNTREHIFSLVSHIINILEIKMGISTQQNYFLSYDDIKIEESLHSILNDKLDLKDPMFLVSENYESVFIKIKNKLENLIRKPEQRIKNIKLFLKVLIDICDTNKIQKTRYDMDLAKMNKQNKKFLKKFDLKSVLMNISLDINRNDLLFFHSSLFIIEEIIKEFLKYLEYSTMEDLGQNLNENGNISLEEFEKAINSEISNKKNLIYCEFLDKFSNKSKNSKDINKINLCFFKFLQIIDNEKLRAFALDIIFYLNSSKNVFYYNVHNLVIMDDINQFNKFISIKDIFIEIFDKIKALNLAPRLDNNSLVILVELSKLISDLLDILFNDLHWTKANNALKKEKYFQFEDSKGLPGDFSDEDENSLQLVPKGQKIIEEEDDKESEKEEEMILTTKKEEEKEENKSIPKSFHLESIKTDSEHVLETKNNGDDGIEDDEKYFLRKYDSKNMKIFQRTLYNLDFIDFIVDFFGYIDKLTELKSDLEGEFKVLEEAIISIYKILVAFIHNDSDYQSLIKFRLYLFICPLKLKNISSDLLYSINYFIFHLVHNFKNKNDYAKISHIDNVIDKLYLLHQIDWQKHKRVMPYFLKTLLMFFKYSTPEHIFSIFTLLNDIKNIIIEDIMTGNCNNNTILMLTKILDFHEKELQNKEIKENKYRPLLSMSSIIKMIPKLLEFLIPYSKPNLRKFSCSRPLILIINIIINYYDPYYKSDLEKNKIEIFNSLINFCKKIIIKSEYIFIEKKGSKTSKEEDINIKSFNILMGLKLPQLYNFFTYLEISGSNIITDKLNQFYEKFFTYINSNQKIYLLTKEYAEEILYIYDQLGSFMPALHKVIEAKKNLFETESVNDYDDKKSEDSSFVENDEKEVKVFHEGKFYNKAKNEIEIERKDYIKNLFYFYDFINKNNINNAFNNDKDVCFYINFCDSYSKTFGNYVLKSRIFFLYWTNIYLMNYNESKNEFEDDNPIYNKKYFNDLSFVEYTIECFEKMNLNINNYENFIYIKFLDNYLFKLDEENSAKFLLKIIEMPESRNLFHLLHNILDNLHQKIKNDIDTNKESKNFMDICPSSINEKKIDDFFLAIKFLTHLSEDNNIIQNKMKDYLRLQYNNSKNHNFIIICSEILSIFSNYENVNYIYKYYLIIIALIDFLIKSCSGQCKGNQDCIVKHEGILNLIQFILKRTFYREQLFDMYGKNFNETEVHFVEPINRRKLCYLKFKLLNLLNILTIGRKKGDKIFEAIHRIINFDVLENVLTETFKEILIETNSQNNPDNFTFEEDMQFRMDDLKSYLKETKPEEQCQLDYENELGHNFIIYENGTFSYLLINIYLEKLTRPSDMDAYEKIKELKKNLEKEKCTIVSKGHFHSFIKSITDYYDNLKKCFKMLLGTCGNCFISKENDIDFRLDSCIDKSFSFYFKNTPHIEICFNGKIEKYYIKLSPICKCLTREMKDEFHVNIDRSSAKTKISNLFDQVKFFKEQLTTNKKILDTFSKSPILNLIFNHYMFYRNLFLIIAVLINLLIFMSFYRTTDDEREVTKDDYDLHFDYGFLYRKSNIPATKRAFMALTIIELVLATLILLNYFILRFSYFLYYKKDKNYDEDKKKDKNEIHRLSKNRDILRKLMSKFGTFIWNLITDVKFIYHLFLFIMIIVTLAWDQRYKILSMLLLDIIERSNTLMCIVKSFWLPKKQIVVTLVLFYLIAYYFIILVYLFIPEEVPEHDCLKFSNCYFTLCDQAIKNSNGIINYLIEEGLFISDSLWSNPRFWIDNWFAIFDIMLVMQMFCGIIIDTYLSQRETIRDIEKDKNSICFICGLNKNELNKYYSSEFGFNEHIKLDHYLWNYMFAVFNVTSAEESKLISLDRAIKNGYETNVYSSWVPYKKCFNQIEKESNQKENNEEDEENNKEEDED